MSDHDTSAGIPVFLTGHALRSLRDSGYNFAAAVGEIIDNSIEANANRIQVRLDTTTNRGKRKIHQVTTVDDGDGMDLETLQRYPQIGFSTRYMSTTTIGKYGVGAKLSALSYGTRLDVWTRTSGTEPWRHVYFDLDEALDQESDGVLPEIAPPDAEPLPVHLPLSCLPDGAGTVVLWPKVDRLEEDRRDPDEVRVETERELARMFRNFIAGGIKIQVNDVELRAHDPLFLLEHTWADQQLKKHLSKLGRPDVPDHFPARVIKDETIDVGLSKARVRVTLYPTEVIRDRGKGGDRLAKRLRVPENQGALTFMRLDREINYTHVPRIFPRGVEDADRFIGVEVSFKPELDEFFGVRNVKRGVEPHDTLRVKIRKVLRSAIPEARGLLDEIWGEAQRRDGETKGEHATTADAAAEVNRTLPKGRAKTPKDVDPEDLLRELARDLGKTTPEEQAAYLEEVKDRPFVIESVDFPGTLFVDVQHLDGQVIIRVNTRHRFYRELWAPIKAISDQTAGTVSGSDAVKAARRTIQALTLLLIAYGKAESMHEQPRDQFGDLRGYWGQFLDTMMRRVKD